MDVARAQRRRRCGASRAIIVIAQPDIAHLRTELNDRQRRARCATSAHSLRLRRGRGIVLNDVDPGVEATIRWRDVVHNGLPAGEAIVRVAYVHYDGDRTDEIRIQRAQGAARARSLPTRFRDCRSVSTACWDRRSAARSAR